MEILFYIGIAICLISIISIAILFKQKKGFGKLAGNRIYEDSNTFPEEVFYAKTLPLIGKPDYLIKEDGYIIPVEYKSGKTPRTPYQNHVMQLMAYCLLVEENFNVRPKGGYIKYPDKEFKIAYTKEAEEGVRELVQEILEKKRHGEELKCHHPTHA